jgi:cobalt-zinc-cadmium efflux system protein
MTAAHAGHAGHGHADGGLMPAPPATSQPRLWAALALIGAFMVAEVLAGILGDSLALLSDAAHMLTDLAALGLGLVAVRTAARPAAGALTYGLRRVEILAAQLNGATLAALAAAIVYSAVERLIAPAHPAPWTMVVLAGAGIAVNVAVTLLLAGADRGNMSVEGSFQHILTDLFAFIGTLVAGIVIGLTGFRRADPIASLLIAALMVRAGWRLLRASGRVLLEAAPPGLDPPEIGRALAAVPGVVEVHDLHVWQVASGFPALSAHVLVRQDADCHAKRRELDGLLRERFRLAHSTLQVEHAGGEGLIEIERPR